MNYDNFQILADNIRANQEHFKLHHWFYNGSGEVFTVDLPLGEELHICGTAACLCGWVNYITKNIDYNSIQWSDEYHAAKWLGISSNQAYHLFTPRSNIDEGYTTFWTEAYEGNITTNTNPYRIHPSEVADMLEAFAKGELKLL